MKKCDHCKKTECKHEKIEYCECCQKVVCKDCGETWGRPDTIYVYPPVQVPIVWFPTEGDRRYISPPVVTTTYPKTTDDIWYTN